MFILRPMSYKFLGLFFLISFLVCGCSAPPEDHLVEGKISGNYFGCATGAFVSGMGNISPFESMTGKELAIVMWYIDWNASFPEKDLNEVRSRGAIPMITWEPRLAAPYTLEAIASGEYDSYINNFAVSARKWKYRFFLRPMHEMNGFWYPWSGAQNGATTESFIRAWKRIHGIFADNGATNVTFIWSPNWESMPSPEGWNRIQNYYPGDQYVDWVGIDGYNFGSPSRTFSEIFSAPYLSIEVFASKPMMVAEFSSTNEAGKGSWITAAFGNIKDDYPKFKAFVWFNVDKSTLGETDWRVNSTPEARTAYRNAVQDDYFVGNIFFFK